MCRMKPFAGVHTPIVTPFTADDRVDEAALKSNVAKWMATPLTGLVVLGSNGEAPQLEDDEADRVIELVRGGMPKGRPLIVGTGRESTRGTIAATKRAAALGADAAYATELAVSSGRLTGRMAEGNVRAAAKVDRLDRWLGDRPAEVWAYGDSAGDDALLARADHPHRVRGGRGEPGR